MSNKTDDGTVPLGQSSFAPPASQAAYEGSIPFTRSKSSKHQGSRATKTIVPGLIIQVEHGVYQWRIVFAEVAAIPIRLRDLTITHLPRADAFVLAICERLCE